MKDGAKVLKQKDGNKQNMSTGGIGNFIEQSYLSRDVSVLAWDEMNKGKLSIPGRILRNSKGNPQPPPGRHKAS